jgi:hypothetical protein
MNLGVFALCLNSASKKQKTPKTRRETRLLLLDGTKRREPLSGSVFLLSLLLCLSKHQVNNENNMNLGVFLYKIDI